MPAGIYHIIHVESGKRYIGSSVVLSRRKRGHFNDLKKGQHHSPRLQNAFNKYGRAAFEWEVLEVVPDISTDNISPLLKCEQEYLDKYRPYLKKNGYNISSDAIAPMAGRSHTSKSKALMSKSHLARLQTETSYWKGKSLSDQHKQKISEAMSGENHHAYGDTYSEQRRFNISEGLRTYYKEKGHPSKGRSLSEEHKRRISENHADVSGENNPMWGKTMSIESRRKMSQSHSGKTFSQERRSIMSAAQKKRHKKFDHPNAKITKQVALWLHVLYNTGSYTYKDLSDMCPISPSMVGLVIRGEKWKQAKIKFEKWQQNQQD